MGKSVSFHPETDIPSLSGKVILVTGGSAGLGKQSILELSRHKPAQIWLAARNLTKAATAADEIKQTVPDAPIQLLELDLGSLASVQKAATTFLAQASRLDILMLNAGIMATPAGLTTDGYEIQFGTNHVGHALLAKLLLPLLLQTAKADPKADVRLVVLASDGYAFAPKEGIIWDTVKTTAEELTTYNRYGQSKLANIVWAREMATRYPEVTVVPVHPGIVQTNLLDGAKGAPRVLRAVLPVMRLMLTSVDKGVRNQLWAATGEGVKSGTYYEPVGVSGLEKPLALDKNIQKQVWDWTEKELEPYKA